MVVDTVASVSTNECRLTADRMPTATPTRTSTTMAHTARRTLAGAACPATSLTERSLW
jgi:hypothetical protein